MSKSNSFKCQYCGTRFSLNKVDFQCYLDGGFMEIPNMCNECQTDPINRFDDLNFSDADPGL